MKKFVSYIFILLGISLILLGSYLIYLRQSPKLISFKGNIDSHQISTDNTPVKIEIPVINLILPITSAITDGKNWETTNFGVSYLANTPIPGSQGNSVLYGHNWESLLGNLHKVKPGNIIKITLNNGDKKEFRVEYTAIVNPNQIYIIKNTSDTRITLYTCTGFLDSKRFVVIAKPIS